MAGILRADCYEKWKLEIETSIESMFHSANTKAKLCEVLSNEERLNLPYFIFHDFTRFSFP